MPFLHASPKSGNKEPVIGSGDHAYEVHHDWGELPAEIAYGNCHGVREDSQGRIFIHHTVNASSQSGHTMVVFDGKGKFIQSWGKRFKGGAHGLHLDKEGKQELLYLRDTRRSIAVKTKDPGSLNSPHGIYIDKRSGKEELLAADRSNNRPRYFDLDGRHLRFVSNADNALPCHFHFRRDPMLIPGLGARVVILDKNNKLAANSGDDSGARWRETRKLARDKFTPGKFVCPHGACFDHKGNIFVAEWVEVGRVTKPRKV